MALPASALSPKNFRITLFKHQPCQLHTHLLKRIWTHPTSVTCAVKLPTMAHFREPPKAKMYINSVREKIWEVIPDSVKDIPWKKAEVIMLQQLLVVGREALKWSLIALFTLSSISDVMYSISMNKELMIPFGLFVGCIMTDFLKEISQELFHNSEERGLNQDFLGIGCFFVFVKIISLNFLVPGRVFLLHVANGGLMQVLWLWRSLREKQDRDDRENSLLEDVSTASSSEV